MEPFEDPGASLSSPVRWRRKTRWVLVSLLALLLPWLGQGAAPGPDTFVLALDGVGYEHAVEAIRRGHLQGFRAPVPVVSTFPSLTGVCFTGMVQPLGFEPAPGYENRHFDRKRNKLWGGIPYLHFSWHNYFDIDHNSLPRKTLGYTWPGWISRKDAQRAIREVLRNPRPFTAAYLSNPDALTHMKGMKGGVEFLADLEVMLTQLHADYRRQHGRELRILLFSDHGQTNIRQRAVRGFKKHLKKGGFKLQGSIKSDRSVVIAPFGYVEAGMLFCRDSIKAELARWMVRLDGIELAAYPQGDTVVIVDSAGGEAIVEAVLEPQLTARPESVESPAPAASTAQPDADDPQAAPPTANPGAGAPQAKPLASKPDAGAPQAQPSASQQDAGLPPEAGPSAAQRIAARRIPVKLRYRVIQGDPLRHLQLLQRLRAEGLVDAEGFVPAQVWLEQSVHTEFPDALYRVYDAFFSANITNTASVIFMTKPGRAYGHPVTRALSWARGGRLDATHGSLTRDASLAMLATDDPDLPLPLVLRYDQILPWLDQLRPASLHNTPLFVPTPH